ncbi:MAG: DUF4962 domain-containing protein [Armatimonadetes bacterium]|nr:DUF4962 domain-containing protein [Armatimonadota bacterium]
MKGSRHPHPHLDPRQPRDGSRPGTNPPVFAWKPREGDGKFELLVARDPGLTDTVIQVSDLSDPMFLPEQALTPGRYWWRWSAGGDDSETFSFEMTDEAVVLEVPPAVRWLELLPEGHPRLYVLPDEVEALRASREGERAGQWAALKEAADALLDESHEYPEPPWLPDRRRNYEEWFAEWLHILWSTRRFVREAETLAFAYLASGEKSYARAACQRMASVSRWDPEGSTSIPHNDEAHMSVIWDGSKVCDWVWDEFTDDERALVIEQFRRRGQLTYQSVHDHGCYGVTQFGSHAGREIVFLALIGLVFHEHIPEAREWLDWLRPVLCGIWPIWAGDDGAWAEGPSYGLAYVGIMTMFASALKKATGVDLYRRPFWRGHAIWRQWFWPPYAEWIGFGDHTERWRSSWLRNADLVELIGRETGTREFDYYVAALRREAETMDTPDKRRLGDEEISPLRYLHAHHLQPEPPETGGGVLRVFPAAGQAAVRTDLTDPDRDIALLFRSSPYGAISHSHANNNDFIMHVAGKCMTMPSGYYDGYGSNHHAHWVWHTKSHNCVTLSDAGQIMRSPESTGAVINAFEDDTVAYFCGNADAGYADRATRCRRHVLFVKPHQCFLMVDEFEAVPGIVSALQWNLHSWNEFDVDEQERRFTLEREGSALVGHIMCHFNAFFSLTEGWDPPPSTAKDSAQWYQQYHLRFTVSGLVERQRLGVVLCPSHAGLEPAPVVTEWADDVETARIGDDVLMVNHGGGMSHQDITSDALALAVIGGRAYEITDAGLQAIE